MAAGEEYKDLAALLGALKAFNGEAHKNGVDPSYNVLQLVAAEGRRQDDLRNQAEYYRELLDTQKEKADESARKEEASRINGLLSANTNNVALALEKQGAQATAQDKRIAVLEQNQYSGAGRDIQRVEGKQDKQWGTGVMVAIGLGGSSFFLGFLTFIVLIYRTLTGH